MALLPRPDLRPRPPPGIGSRNSAPIPGPQDLLRARAARDIENARRAYYARHERWYSYHYARQGHSRIVQTVRTKTRSKTRYIIILERVRYDYKAIMKKHWAKLLKREDWLRLYRMSLREDGTAATGAGGFGRPPHQVFNAKDLEGVWKCKEVCCTQGISVIEQAGWDDDDSDGSSGSEDGDDRPDKFEGVLKSIEHDIEADDAQQQSDDEPADGYNQVEFRGGGELGFGTAPFDDALAQLGDEPEKAGHGTEVKSECQPASGQEDKQDDSQGEEPEEDPEHESQATPEHEPEDDLDNDPGPNGDELGGNGEVIGEMTAEEARQIYEGTLSDPLDEDPEDICAVILDMGRPRIGIPQIPVQLLERVSSVRRQRQDSRGPSGTQQRAGTRQRPGGQEVPRPSARTPQRTQRDDTPSTPPENTPGRVASPRKMPQPTAGRSPSPTPKPRSSNRPRRPGLLGINTQTPSPGRTYGLGQNYERYPSAAPSPGRAYGLGQNYERYPSATPSPPSAGRTYGLGLNYERYPTLTPTPPRPGTTSAVPSGRGTTAGPSTSPTPSRPPRIRSAGPSGSGISPSRETPTPMAPRKRTFAFLSDIDTLEEESGREAGHQPTKRMMRDSWEPRLSDSEPEPEYVDGMLDNILSNIRASQRTPEPAPVQRVLRSHTARAMGR